MFRSVITACAVALMLVPNPALASEALACVQSGLASIGYAPGPADGLMGSRTRNAAAQFVSDTGRDLPELTDTSADSWCAAVTDFASSPAAHLLSAPVADLIPGDVLLGMSAADPQRSAQMCSAPPAGLDQIAGIEPVRKIAGFTSRMSGDAERIAGARESERFAAGFAAQAAAAFVAGDAERKGRLLDVLATWAEAGAWLDTISCVRPNGDLITTGQCTEWTVPDGSDPSGMKDATFVTFLAAGIIRAYVIALADFEPVEKSNQHAAIAEWINGIGRRLKRPTSVYFGLNMGWYWPAILNDYAQRNPGAARQKLQQLISGIDSLLLADGSIKDRTTRGDRALWYHYTSLGEVVVSLEFARAAGVTIPADLEERLHRAVKLFIDAIEDPASIEPWAKVAHNSRYDGYQDWNTTGWQNADFGGSWLHIYPYRFPERDEARRLRELVSPTARSASSDVDFGFGLGCLYNAAAPPMAVSSSAVGTADEPATAPRLTFKGATITTDFEDDVSIIYKVRLSAAKLDGNDVHVSALWAFTDFAGSNDEVANLELFRLGFMRSSLRDEASRAHDYARCGDVAVQQRGDDQQLRLHVGNESGRNACIFDGMAPADRDMWETILSEVGAVIAAAQGRPAETLQGAYDFAAR